MLLNVKHHMSTVYKLTPLIPAMILCYHKEDSTAARLQIPYLLWLTFAGYLNFWVARNN